MSFPTPPRAFARTAGLLYVAIIGLGIRSEGAPAALRCLTGDAVLGKIVLVVAASPEVVCPPR
ncbi:MAG: hypothetical protein H6739_23695 [Alphaproteobacteria bacterium]|nr:hypothetical protein [Alphaproteobacteria bacterium]